jgi:excisionase family DNA binding protein
MTPTVREQSSARMLNTHEAAMVLGVHQRTVRRYISMGLLAHQRLPGGHYRIAEQDILAPLGAERSGPRHATRSTAWRAQF